MLKSRWMWLTREKMRWRNTFPTTSRTLLDIATMGSVIDFLKFASRILALFISVPVGFVGGIFSFGHVVFNWILDRLWDYAFFGEWRFTDDEKDD